MAPSTPPPPAIQFALAVLLVDERYVLQLRDDKPGIAAPGLWGLFGGRLEPGETPAAALVREIQEELMIALPSARLFWQADRLSEFHRTQVRYWLFEADVTGQWPCHRVTEGQGAGLFLYEETAGLPVHPFVPEVLMRHHSVRKRDA